MSRSRELLDRVEAKSAEIVRLVAAGRLEQAEQVSRQRHAELAQLLSFEEARRDAGVVSSLGAMLGSISSMLSGLERSRSECIVKILHVQQAHRAVQSYARVDAAS
jgi:hypothetical protein